MSHGPVVNASTFESVITFMTRYGKTTSQTSRIKNVVEEDDKTITTEYRMASNYFYDVTLEGLPVLDNLVIKKPANVLDDEPPKSTFDDLFDSAMGILD